MSVSPPILAPPDVRPQQARSDVGRRYVAAAVQTGLGGIMRAKTP